jgi:dihydroflavonol-4-reductase
MAIRGKAFVTGASGFLGSAVVRAALGEGLEVRALVRATSPRKNVAGLDIEIVEGDVCDPSAMREALRGVRYLFHVAADYRLWTPDSKAMFRTNVLGTKTVMDAAVRGGVERIVYTSSVATLRPPRRNDVSDETQQLSESEAIGPYKRSKVAAEREIERMALEGLPVVIVHPSTPIGPRDIRPTPTGRVILEAARGRMPAFIDTGLNLVGVDDVAAGHLLALRSGRVGGRYILGGDNVALREFLAQIACRTGRAPPRLRLPRWPLYPLAMGAEAIAQITRSEPFLTLDGLKMSRRHMFFSSAKAVRELGYAPRPYLDGLEGALTWFREARYLR